MPGKNRKMSAKEFFADVIEQDNTRVEKPKISENVNPGGPRYFTVKGGAPHPAMRERRRVEEAMMNSQNQDGSYDWEKAKEEYNYEPQTLSGMYHHSVTRGIKPAKKVETATEMEAYAKETRAANDPTLKNRMAAVEARERADKEKKPKPKKSWAQRFFEGVE